MISQKESIAISLIRVFSMLAIVICHICETYSNHWAFIFNVGVQVFIALSGYLYGKKLITNWKYWYLSRIKRIYIPFLLFLLLILPLYLLFHKEVFGWKRYLTNLLNIQGFFFVTGGGMLPGIRHLWFITAIMFAYFTTPLLQYLSKKAKVIFPATIICVFLGYIILPQQIMFALSWVYLYAITYLFSHIKQKKLYTFFFIFLWLIMAAGVFYLGWDAVISYFNPISRCFHDLTGVIIVIVIIQLIERITLFRIPKIITYLDTYAYQIYIVHYFLIIGPFSLAHITAITWLNILIMVISTGLVTSFFVLICLLANRLLFDKLFLKIEAK